MEEVMEELAFRRASVRMLSPEGMRMELSRKFWPMREVLS